MKNREWLRDMALYDLPTIINCIVIETMALHLSGALDKLGEVLESDKGQ